MPTYSPRSPNGDLTAPPLAVAKPTPAHVQTTAAQVARDAVEAFAAGRRTRVTRADVEAAYVHPAPLEPANEIALSELDGSARSFARWAMGHNARVKATRNVGTTPPRWTVNAPDSKPNPGPPVEASQYRGELVTCITVYAYRTRDVEEEFATVRRMLAIRAVWLDGKIDHVDVNGVAATITQARAVLA